MTTCKGICDQYKVARSNVCSPYALGFKQCIYCEVFLEWKGKLCPCCNTNLRGNPRKKAQKEKLRRLLSRKNIQIKVLKSFVSAAALCSMTGICINHGIQYIVYSI